MSGRIVVVRAVEEGDQELHAREAANAVQPEGFDAAFDHAAHAGAPRSHVPDAAADVRRDLSLERNPRSLERDEPDAVALAREAARGGVDAEVLGFVAVADAEPEGRASRPAAAVERDRQADEPEALAGLLRERLRFRGGDGLDAGRALGALDHVAFFEAQRGHRRRVDRRQRGRRHFVEAERDLLAEAPADPKHEDAVRAEPVGQPRERSVDRQDALGPAILGDGDAALAQLAGGEAADSADGRRVERAVVGQDEDGVGAILRKHRSSDEQQDGTQQDESTKHGSVHATPLRNCHAGNSAHRIPRRCALAQLAARGADVAVHGPLAAAARSARPRAKFPITSPLRARFRRVTSSAKRPRGIDRDRSRGFAPAPDRCAREPPARRGILPRPPDRSRPET